ncbi:hypothetical protein [Cryobacterium sp. N19]|uniref:hypothetical protein n=1 Tax=Cryobacterium sp. N19 TaxID=2048288 RepID=UPI001E4C3945|nr:hypothetical protein [Cryobacterium sp. N19]
MRGRGALISNRFLEVRSGVSSRGRGLGVAVLGDEHRGFFGGDDGEPCAGDGDDSLNGSPALVAEAVVGSVIDGEGDRVGTLECVYVAGGGGREFGEAEVGPAAAAGGARSRAAVAVAPAVPDRCEENLGGLAEQ